MTAQALTCQFAFWECGKCDSEALLQAVRFWDVGCTIFGDVGCDRLFVAII
ncbi:MULTISPECIES: hypothetical protein [Nostocales]|uniref:Uncharacterized protein n=1 Tax=Dolichospermum flos-aquae CCAP 1403/13F TaxID=315271 RepID=A0A6H2BXT9_DOLFA|nr:MULTISPECIES: hypothetical protein [Nostocales]MBO1053909.1 hypothetical protein [Dolichospermum sp. DET73]MDB9437597.1 hypothetical protein [Dolichospermum lemmermannii CS-548]QJB44057.1 hypothetical protein HGD76_07470 [Dolichospermum flos-aquae CCAP 1403/13F]